MGIKASSEEPATMVEHINTIQSEDDKVIPAFNHSHVLPPYLGDSPTQLAKGSPYETSALELVRSLGHTPARRRLLFGLLQYRADLRALGFVSGFQWLDGSFVENIEARQARPPGDIDVLTFSNTPAGMSTQAVETMVHMHPDLFDQGRTVVRYGCDAYLVRLDGSPERLVRRTAYYFGLFSHRRPDNVWKGLLSLPLLSDDEAALSCLSNLAEGDGHAAAT